MKKRFNLIEFILVIAGISLMASIIYVNVSNTKENATILALQTNVKIVQNALDAYRLDNDNYPIIPSPNSTNEGEINFELLSPDYIKSHPNLEKFKYFMNPSGIVYATEKEFANKVKSGNLYFKDLSNLEKIKADVINMDLNTVNVPIIVNFDSKDDPNMKIDEKSKEDAINVIKMLHKMGVKVILEPYPVIANENISETEYLPSDINAFFWNWKMNVLTEIINDVAKPYQVFAVNSSSNLIKLEYASGYWKDTIEYMRSLYPEGKITYRTNWWYSATWDAASQQAYQEKLNNPLFGSVDFISVSAYFEITDDAAISPDKVAELLQGTNRYNRGQNIYQELKSFHERWNKPVFFGEIGMPNQDGALKEPWNYSPDGTYNETIQGIALQGYQKVFEKENWFMGFSYFSVGYDIPNAYFYPTPYTQQVIHDFFKRYY